MSNYDSIKLAEKKQDQEYGNKTLTSNNGYANNVANNVANNANNANCYGNNIANNANNANCYANNPANDTMISKYANAINRNYEDIIINLALNYNEAYNGCNKPINVERKIKVSQYRRKELNSKQVVEVDKCKSMNQSYYFLYLYNIYLLD